VNCRGNGTGTAANLLFSGGKYKAVEEKDSQIRQKVEVENERNPV
jgi:hypothetical protein